MLPVISTYLRAYATLHYVRIQTRKGDTEEEAVSWGRRILKFVCSLTAFAICCCYMAVVKNIKGMTVDFSQLQ